MTRLFLRVLNAPALILMTIIGVAIQTSFFSFWPLEFFQPDICLIAVIWVALRRNFSEGGILTLLIGNIAEAHSSAPQGTFLITYMLAFLAVRAAAKILVIPEISSYVMVTLVASPLVRLGNLGLVKLLGAGGIPLKNNLFFAATEALVNALIAHWIFRWLDRFDWVTFKNIKAEQVLEDEFQLERPTDGR